MANRRTTTRRVPLQLTRLQLKTLRRASSRAATQTWSSRPARPSSLLERTFPRWAFPMRFLKEPAIMLLGRFTPCVRRSTLPRPMWRSPQADQNTGFLVDRRWPRSNGLQFAASVVFCSHPGAPGSAISISQRIWQQACWRSMGLIETVGL